MPKKKIKKEKKLDRKYWWNKAWKVFSLYIRERDNWTCCACGAKIGETYKNKILTKKNFHAGHWLEQSLLTKYHELNFSELNINCQCAVCNLWFEGNKGLYAEYMISKYGCKIIGILNKKRLDGSILTAEDLEKIYNKYKQLD